MTLLLLLACATPAPAPPTPTMLVPLDGPRLARRMSIDLRGVLPSTEELDSVEAAPENIHALQDAWLADPRFEERLVAMYQERWRTSLDEFRGTVFDYGIDSIESYAFNRSVGEEPLRVVAHVVATDRPYSDIVTADWTMANEMMRDIWPIDYPEGGSGWELSHYNDDRPAAGVLTVNGLWWRYISPIFNNNRARTAAIFDLLVCSDVLSRPVVLSAGLSIVEGDAAEAIKTQAECLACHASIEPVAATLFGFVPLDDQSSLEMETYHPERENLGAELLGVEPAWMGHPVAGLEDLGREIAADPRFVDCAVQTIAEGLLRRSTDATDVVLLRDAREPFVNNGLHLKDAIRSIVQNDRYLAGGFTADADEATIARESTRRMLVATQLRSIYDDLADLSWVSLGYDQLDNDAYGFRVLAGSVDGSALASPQRTPGLTWSLTTQRAAEVSAALIADRDLQGDPALLLGLVEGAVPGDAVFTAALEAAYWRLLATRPTSEDTAELTALYEAAIAAGASDNDAWASVLSVLLRDPAFLSY